MESIPYHNPWFWIFVGWKLFSAATAGLVEPDENSSNKYIWLYRTCHILTDNGTAYFSHKGLWGIISGESCTVQGEKKAGERE